MKYKNRQKKKKNNETLNPQKGLRLYSENSLIVWRE